MDDLQKTSGNTSSNGSTTSTEVPSATSVYIVILLGVVGLIASVTYLLNDCKQSIPGKYNVVVVNNANKPIDTIYANISSNLKTDSSSLGVSSTLKPVPYSKLFFHFNSALFVWISFFSIMMAFSLAMLPVFWYAIKEINTSFSITRTTKLLLILPAVVILVVLLWLNSYRPYYLTSFDTMQILGILFYHPQDLNYFLLIVHLIAMIAIYGKLIVNYAIDNLNKLPTNEIQKASVQFILLRQKLKFFLMSLAAFVVFSVLTTDALRKAISTEVTVNIELFPSNFVYLYGLTFTFFLALLYLPIYFRLRSAGESMVKKLETMVPNGDKEKLAKSFIIEESPLQSLQIALSILSPIISSLLPDLINL